MADAKESALYLLAHVFNGKSLPFAQRLLREDAVLLPSQAGAFTSLCAQRASRVPLQYLIGSWDFSCLKDVACRAPVLCPRPDTEDLASLALLAARAVAPPAGGGSSLRLLDIGTGSGVIGAALLAQLPSWCGVGIDVSAAAVALARENAQRAGVARRFSIVPADLRDFTVVPAERFNLLVSNPPYIDSAAFVSLEPEVRLHEDPGALVGGEPRGLGLTLSILGRAHLWAAGRGVPLFLEVDSHHPVLLHALLEGQGAPLPWLLPGGGLGAPARAAAVAPLSAHETAQAERALAGCSLGDLKGLWQWQQGYYCGGMLPRIVHLSLK